MNVFKKSMKRNYFVFQIFILLVLILGSCQSPLTIESSAKANLPFSILKQGLFTAGSLAYVPSEPEINMISEGQTIPFKIRKMNPIHPEKILGEVTLIGYLEILNINSAEIIFSETGYNPTGSQILFKDRVRLKLNESISLDDSGTMNLSYSMGDSTRAGFSEARYLSFLHDENSGTTALARLLVGEGEDLQSYPSGIVAINPSGRMVISAQANPTATRLLSSQAGNQGDLGFLKSGDILLGEVGELAQVGSRSLSTLYTPEEIKADPSKWAEVKSKIVTFEYSDVEYSAVFDPREGAPIQLQTEEGFARSLLSGIPPIQVILNLFKISLQSLDIQLDFPIKLVADFKFSSAGTVFYVEKSEVSLKVGMKGKVSVKIDEVYKQDFRQFLINLGIIPIPAVPGLYINVGDVGLGLEVELQGKLNTEIDTDFSIKAGVNVKGSAGLDSNNWYLPFVNFQIQPILETTSDIKFSNTTAEGNAIIRPYIYYQPSVSYMSILNLGAAVQPYAKNILTYKNNSTEHYLSNKFGLGVKVFGFYNLDIETFFFGKFSFGGTFAEFDTGIIIPENGVEFTIPFGAGPTEQNVGDDKSKEAKFYEMINDPIITPITGDLFVPYIEDVSGDGLPDLIAVGRFPGSKAGIVKVALGLVSGGFGAWLPEQAIIDSDALTSVYFEDVNGDNKVDIVCVPDINRANSGNVYVGLSTTNSGSGFTNFEAWSGVSPLLDTNVSDSVYFADINGDGFLDIIANPPLGAWNSNTLYVGFGNGKTFSGWSLVLPVLDQFYKTELHFEDVNGDGADDLIAIPSVGAPNHGRVYVGMSTVVNEVRTIATWSAINVVLSNTGSHRVFFADVMGSTGVDLIAVASVGAPDAGTVYVYESITESGFWTGFGTNASNHPEPDGATYRNYQGSTKFLDVDVRDNLYFAQLNNDGKSDMLVVPPPGRSNTNTVYIGLSRGDGSFGDGNGGWNGLSQMLDSDVNDGLFFVDSSSTQRAQIIAVPPTGRANTGWIYQQYFDSTNQNFYGNYNWNFFANMEL